MRLVARCAFGAAVILFAHAHLFAGASQAVVTDGWQNNYTAFAKLHVGVDLEGACQSALIVGHDDTRIVALTPYNPALQAALGDAGRVPVRVFSVAEPTPVPATLLRREGGRALLAISDPGLVSWVKQQRFDVIGDAEGLMPRDQFVIGGCLNDSIAQQVPMLRSLKGSLLADLSSVAPSLRETFIGAPVAHLVGRHVALVGTVVDPGARGQARTLNQDHGLIEPLKLPVTLTPVGTSPGCAYSSVIDPKISPRTPRDVTLGSVRGLKTTITIDAPPNCAWMVLSDGAPWLRATATGSSRLRGLTRMIEWVGPGVVTVETVQANHCSAPLRYAIVLIAGRAFQVMQDSTNC